MKTKKKYDDGGKVTGADIRNAKKAAKLKRIEAGTEPSGYEKAATAKRKSPLKDNSIIQ